jgi:hypothetical protein
MPEPDFDQIAATLLREMGIYEDGVSQLSIAEQLRLVWNARGAADRGKLDLLVSQWRKEADELDATTNGLWIEPSVKRNCADELADLLQGPAGGAPADAPEKSNESTGVLVDRALRTLDR